MIDTQELMQAVETYIANKKKHNQIAKEIIAFGAEFNEKIGSVGHV